MHALANPTRFLSIARKVLPVTAVATVLTLGLGLYLAFFASPPDYQQGDTVRIMYVHVPSAWMALASYAVVALASLTGFVWKHGLAFLIAKAAAPIGAAFTIVTLATGSLWGRPMWGTWWEWDARMTSVLILLFIYLGYMALWRAIDDKERAAKAAGILALVGAVNLPIIKYSVEWWNTLHQPASVMRLGGPTIDATMLWPLFVMALAASFYFVTVLLWRVRCELALRRLDVARRHIAAGI